MCRAVFKLAFNKQVVGLALRLSICLKYDCGNEVPLNRYLFVLTLFLFRWLGDLGYPNFLWYLQKKRLPSKMGSQSYSRLFYFGKPNRVPVLKRYICLGFAWAFHHRIACCTGENEALLRVFCTRPVESVSQLGLGFFLPKQRPQARFCLCR